MEIEKLTGISIQTRLIEEIGFFLLEAILEKMVAAKVRIGLKMNHST